MHGDAYFGWPLIDGLEKSQFVNFQYFFKIIKYLLKIKMITNSIMFGCPFN